MGDGDGNFWDPYCCCRVTRKNIVMTILTILCFALVFWTVFETSHEEELPPKANVTQVKFKADTPLSKLEIVISDQANVTFKKETMTKAEKEKRKLDDAKKAYEEFIHGIQLIRRDIMINSTEEGELCQCVCKLNITLEEAKQALEYMLQELNEKVDTSKQDWNKECYNKSNVTIDTNPWECLDEPPEPAPKEEEEQSPVTPNTSQLLKTLK